MLWNRRGVVGSDRWGGLRGWGDVARQLGVLGERRVDQILGVDFGVGCWRILHEGKGYLGVILWLREIPCCCAHLAGIEQRLAQGLGTSDEDGLGLFWRLGVDLVGIMGVDYIRQGLALVY